VLAELGELYDLTVTLRRECPWDRKQTQEDIIAYTLEETYELVGAVQSPEGEERHEAIRGELGDLLFQVYFLAQVAAQEGWYDLGEVAADIRHKLIRRHPHIFGEASAETPDEVRRTWDEIKRRTEGREGIFHEVPEAFPATLFAQKLQQRAATVGFDWRHAQEVFAKIEEEIGELQEVLAGPPAGSGRDAADRRVTEEVGDLLFAVVNLARKLRADPELALRSAAERFRQRVEEAERLAAAEGRSWSEIDLEAQEAYFQKAKARMRATGGG